VNKWGDDNTKAQHLMLALEGNAAEVLKEISDSSPTVLQNSKSGSRDPHITPFHLILDFFVSTHCRPSLCQI